MIEEILTQVNDEITRLCSIDMGTNDVYRWVLKGCLVKCFEVGKVVWREHEKDTDYFIASSLRGVCEDFIVLRHFQANVIPGNRDELLLAMFKRHVDDSTEKQVRFFSKRRPFQPVMSRRLKNPPAKGGIPPIRNMASQLGLDDIYDFIYAISSDVVHFNPRMVLRNVWGDTQGTAKVSTANFSDYYRDFTRTYSVYFLCEYVSSFRGEFDFSPEFREAIVKLNAWLADKLRWPEAVTFEEMNVEGPSDAERILRKLAARAP